jgi:uncharacterized protein (DUF302 family)
LHRALLALVAMIVWMSVAAGAMAQGSDIVRRPVKGTFEEVRDRVAFAVESEGLVLNYTAHIGDMLERTGRDVGAARRVFDKAQMLEFCSASASRRSMEADPHNIVFCPYAIAVYTLPDVPGIVHVAYRRVPAVRGLAPTRELLERIVREAAR